MIRRSLILLAIGLASTVQAQVCQRLEFAEMEAMDREDLLALRCEYRRDMLTAPAAGRYGTAAANRCAQELSRMDRILGRKYGLETKGNDLIRELNAQPCPK